MTLKLPMVQNLPTTRSHLTLVLDICSLGHLLMPDYYLEILPHMDGVYRCFLGSLAQDIYMIPLAWAKSDYLDPKVALL